MISMNRFLYLSFLISLKLKKYHSIHTTIKMLKKYKKEVASFHNEATSKQKYIIESKITYSSQPSPSSQSLS